MYALGFYFTEEFDTPGWSIEFVTDDFHEAIQNLADAREDAAAGNYLWYGATLMVLVKTDEGEEWQALSENIKETQ